MQQTTSKTTTDFPNSPFFKHPLYIRIFQKYDPVDCRNEHTHPYLIHTIFYDRYAEAGGAFFRHSTRSLAWLVAIHHIPGARYCYANLYSNESCIDETSWGLFRLFLFSNFPPVPAENQIEFPRRNSFAAVDWV